MDMGDETTMGQKLGEQSDDVDVEMSDRMSDLEVQEPVVPEVDLSAVQTQLRAEIEEAEAGKEQEAQAAECTEDSSSNEVAMDLLLYNRLLAFFELEKCDGTSRRGCVVIHQVYRNILIHRKRLRDMSG